ERQLAAGEKVIVGLNRFTAEDEQEIELHRLDPEAERRQVERTKRVRAERDGARAEAALRAVRECARGDGNLLYPMREALAARCTVGEVCEVLRAEFGTYDAQIAP
ncbi:MAG TPA: methylmalonyl-CoA mutase family protein, partial [Gaiellaceae bacterium]|nr:methylmalonyl-CoA mutase family protein [Gaiellaceae bacterium]